MKKSAENSDGEDKITEKAFTKGKKKEAVARATVKEGKGKVKINNQPLNIYGCEINRRVIKEPINIAKEVLEDEMDEVDIQVNAQGGGKSGQSLAARTAIGKALIGWSDSEELKKRFMDYDRSILVDDYRRKEPKKPLRKGARAKPTKSYR